GHDVLVDTLSGKAETHRRAELERLPRPARGRGTAARHPGTRGHPTRGGARALPLGTPANREGRAAVGGRGHLFDPPANRRDSRARPILCTPRAARPPAASSATSLATSTDSSKPRRWRRLDRHSSIPRADGLAG